MATDSPHQLMTDFHLPDFVASKCWVKKFRSRHRLSLRVPHYEEAIIKHGYDHILNMDETFVPNPNLPRRVVARRGQNGVKVIRKNSCNQKEGTLFIASVSMSNNNPLPLAIVAKGKTSRCEKKYLVDIPNNLIAHSPSGWTTSEVMKEYLVWLWEKMGNKPFCLILDVFKPLNRWKNAPPSGNFSPIIKHSKCLK